MCFLSPTPSSIYKPFLHSPFQSSSLISSATAAALLSSGAVDYCLHVLKSLLEYWKSQQNDEEPVAASQLLKPHTTSSPPDMSPFFLRQYVKVRAFPGQSCSCASSRAHSVRRVKDRGEELQEGVCSPWWAPCSSWCDLINALLLGS